ncbi:MAG: TetR/AcrR family transcriptional regulator [Thiolinea sp.]
MSKPEKIAHLHAKAKDRSDKRSKRKTELVDAALETLKQLGYARTSLRDIAKVSGVSVGVLHYYFEDKTDLIIFCVRKYKKDFIAAMDNILFGSDAPDSAAHNFSKGLSQSIRNDAQTHRLWYDMRSQALFEESLQEMVTELEQGLLGLVERLMERLGLPQEQALPIYLLLDGAFRYHLQQYLMGDEAAPEQLQQFVDLHLDRLLQSHQAA